MSEELITSTSFVFERKCARIFLLAHAMPFADKYVINVTQNCSPFNLWVCISSSPWRQIDARNSCMRSVPQPLSLKSVSVMAPSARRQWNENFSIASLDLMFLLFNNIDNVVPVPVPTHTLCSPMFTVQSSVFTHLHRWSFATAVKLCASVCKIASSLFSVCSEKPIRSQTYGIKLQLNLINSELNSVALQTNDTRYAALWQNEFFGCNRKLSRKVRP